MRFFSVMRFVVGLSIAFSAGANVVLLPPSDGDGAAGDAFGFALASCNGESYASSFGDQVPNLFSSNGQVVGSVQQLQYRGTTLHIQQKIQAIEPQDEAYGFSLACANDALFVGAITRSQGERAQVGGVHLYYRENGTLVPQGVIPSPVQQDLARFGSTLAVSPRWFAASAPGISQVFVYERVGAALLLRQTLVSPVGLERGFGDALLFDGDTLWVGIPRAADSAGEVRRYRLTDGAQIARVTGPLSFGASLALAENTAARLWVGAPDSGLGQVLVFDSAQQLTQAVRSPDQSLSPAGFGARIAILGADVVIAAPRAPVGSQPFIGAVYHYRLQNGSATLVRRYGPEQTSPSNASHAELFGDQIAFSGPSRLLVSASQANGASLPIQGRMYSIQLNSNAMLDSLDSGRGLSFERIGQVMSADSDAIILGSQSAASIFGPETGRAYIFERGTEGYRFAQLLEPPDVVVEQRFGAAVDIQGQTAVVGSIWNVIDGELDAGSAYVFQRANGSWQFLQKLVSNTPSEAALFGSAISIDGGWLAIGARSQRQPAFDQGGVELFQRDQAGRWQFRQALQAPDGAAFDFFGGSVRLRGDHLLIGAPGARRIGSDAGGRVFRYQRIKERWDLTHILADPTGSPGAAFGFALQFDANGDALIGAPQQSVLGSNGAGTVLRFEPSGALRQRYRAPFPQPDGFFGISLATRADGLLIGAAGQDSLGIDSGAVYWFIRDNIVGEELLLSAQQQANVGRNVALPSGRVERLIGAPGLARANPQEGGIFVLALSPADDQFQDGFEKN